MTDGRMTDKVMISLRLPRDLVDQVDEVRGTTSRTSYLRTLIEVAVDLARDGVLSEPQKPEVYDPRREMMVEEKPKPKPKIKIVPTKDHRHSFGRSTLPIRSEMRGRLQHQIYLFTCDCGETKEGLR